MIPALPLVGKILVDLVASGAGVAATPQDADPKTVNGAANSADFTQAVDDLQRAVAAGSTPHGAHGAARS
jgi:hypothetical protein